MSSSITTVSSGLDNYITRLLFKSRFSVLHFPLIKMRVTNEKYINPQGKRTGKGAPGRGLSTILEH